MEKYLLVIVLLILLSGCGNKKEIVKIKMNCNKEVTTHTVKSGDVLSCSLFSEEYKITITSIDKDIAKIEVSEYGLTDSNNLLDKKNKFEFSKDESLKLTTQTTDYQESLELSYES